LNILAIVTRNIVFHILVPDKGRILTLDLNISSRAVYNSATVVAQYSA
jgi:hypothetical protein